MWGWGAVFIRFSGQAGQAGPTTRDEGKGVCVCLPKYSTKPQTIGRTW